jgi:hypothetical protein
MEGEDHQEAATSAARRKRLSGDGEGENVFLLEQTNQLKVRLVLTSLFTGCQNKERGEGRIPGRAPLSERRPMSYRRVYA